MLTIIVNQAPTATVIEELVNINHNFLTASPITIHNTDGLALELNRLKEKSARYLSHKDFISQYIKSKLVPKGLELTLEPTIGNYDQDFIDNWYSNLKDFSLVLMERIVSFCDKTKEETTIKINSTESILKQKLEKKEYEEIKKTITSNEAAIKKISHQRKFKKYNSLKDKPTPTVKVKKLLKKLVMQKTVAMPK